VRSKIKLRGAASDETDRSHRSHHLAVQFLPRSHVEVIAYLGVDLPQRLVCRGANPGGIVGARGPQPGRLARTCPRYRCGFFSRGLFSAAASAGMTSFEPEPIAVSALADRSN
jgi:hypothetical protein